MKILLTGISSGIGEGLCDILQHEHELIRLSREKMDLSEISNVIDCDIPYVDMLINCAGTDIGGKIHFTEHDDTDIVNILNTNLLSPLLLTKKALKLNSQCKIVNVTSTNNNRYYPNNLAYSISKKSLSAFGDMLRVEFPNIKLLEVCLGLTKTNFNLNRYSKNPERFDDIYANNNHLTVQAVTTTLSTVLFDDSIKFIEISP